MQLMVLSHNPNINNNKLTLKDFAKKVKEESDELVKAIEEGDIDHIAEEALDNIQINIAVLDKLESQGLDIKQAVNKHLKKLKSRKWRYKKMIVFQVYRWIE